jgi:hypothetical protein
MNTESKDELKIILEKLLSYVGATWPGWEFFKKDDWYFVYQWSEEDQENFEDWMVAYLHENKVARETICTIPTRNLRALRKAVQQFIFLYGWWTHD